LPCPSAIIWPRAGRFAHSLIVGQFFKQSALDIAPDQDVIHGSPQDGENAMALTKEHRRNISKGIRE
jgi:hypothetical protein